VTVTVTVTRDRDFARTGSPDLAPAGRGPLAPGPAAVTVLSRRASAGAQAPNSPGPLTGKLLVTVTVTLRLSHDASMASARTVMPVAWLGPCRPAQAQASARPGPRPVPRPAASATVSESPLDS
jgi:hypothetical protein